ncbi:MAG: winged helix DNA-binding domain-containing protein [Candidatus Poribacteria bacterium]|nr:winged helix DNA-binding domain-containing protein [Candidatus Poribacteria bacterium]
MFDLDISTVYAERLRRQGLTARAETPEAYRDLVRILQPVATDMGPGSPPHLVHRCAFDDVEEAARMRGTKEYAKGRFLAGTVGYVLAEDLELYAITFRRPIPHLTEVQEAVLKVVREKGPIKTPQIREETGILGKHIAPALNRMQEACLIYEDQISHMEWERICVDFAAAWANVDLHARVWEDAAAEVLERFLENHVFATTEQIKDWSGWTGKRLNGLLDELEQEGQIFAATLEDVYGWVRPDDADLPPQDIPRATFMLHDQDILVRSHRSELKERFKGLKVLQHLLIDGEFKGAVVGQWKIGPHDVDDVVVELPADEVQARRDEILAAVATGYRPPRHNVLRYAGERLA